MRRFFFYCLFLLPVLFLIPFLGDFIYSRGSDFSDVAISHYPNAIWIQQAIRQWGEIPLWSSTILSGYPFAANPLSGLWYFPAWPGLLFPLPLGLNLNGLVHLVLGGFGMYRLLRAEGLDRGPAMVGALAFEGMPKMMAHLGAGHLTLLYAVSWTPWLLLSQRLANDLPRRYRLLPGLVLGMIALADVRWLPLAGVLWAAYGIRLAVMCRKEHGPDISKSRIGTWIVSTGLNGVVALGLSAVLVVPMVEYYQLSTRSLMTAQDAMTLSMPPGQLFGLLAPDIGGLAEWVVYPGSLVFFLAVLSMGIKTARTRVGFWLGVTGVALLFSLGAYLPGLSFLGQAPGMNLLRVPPRMAFLAGLALAICAAEMVQFLSDDPDWGSRLRRINVTMLLSGITFFIILLIPAVWASSGEFPIRFAWGGVGEAISLAILLLARGKRIRVSVLPLFAGVLILVDLAGVNILGLEFRPASTVLAQGSEVVKAMGQSPEASPWRVYSPSYSLPQQTAAYYSIELADGVDPLQLEAYARYMTAASGVPSMGYSVSMPPFNNGDPSLDNSRYIPDTHLLGLLSVRYVISEFPLDLPSARLTGTYGRAWLYELDTRLPRAWVQPAESPTGMNLTPVDFFREKANEIEIYAAGPGLLVLSEVFYPGWQAWVDNTPTRVRALDGLFRVVDLPEGDHFILLRFQPISVFIGGVISAIFWLGIGWIILVKKGIPLVSKAERCWAMWAGLIFMCLTSIPYLAGFFMQNGDWQYTGLLIAAEDGNSYLAKMLLGANGDWLFRTPYSPYPQAGFLAYMPYLILGKLTSPPGQYQQLVALYQMFRFFGGLVAFWATYRFISIFVDSISIRRFGTLLAVAGGGFGFLSLFGLSWLWNGPMGALPLEFYSPETFGFLSYLALPHIVMGRGLLLLGLVRYIRPNHAEKWRSRFSGGLFWLGLSFMQPLTVVVGWFVLGWHLLVWAAWLVIKKENGWSGWWEHFWRAFWMGVISCPLVLYTFISFQLDPFLKRWQAQNLIPSPRLGDYLLAYGLVLPLVVFAVVRWRKSLDEKKLLVIAWAAAFPILAYFPIDIQRRLLEGIWVAISALAVAGIGYLTGWIRKLSFAWSWIGFLSALVLLMGGLFNMISPGFPLFRPADEIDAFTFLAQNAQKGEVVLASNDTANPLPAHAPLTVIDGHGPESLGLNEILPQVQAFYSGSTPDAERIRLVDAFRMKYVIWGPAEKELGDWDPNTSSLFEPVFRNKSYQVFQIRPAGNP